MIKRYSRIEMVKIWEEKNKYQIWLDIEITASQAMEKLNLIPRGISLVTLSIISWGFTPIDSAVKLIYISTGGPHIQPINTELTLIPFGPSSLASIFVAVVNAPLEAAYIDIYFTGVLADNTLYDQYISFPVDIRLDQKGFPLDV